VRFQTIGLLVAVGLALAGCSEKAGGGPNSVSQADGHIILAVCEGIELREVRGSLYTNAGRVDLLHLTGSAFLPAGTILGATLFPGLEGSSITAQAANVEAIDVRFEGVGNGASWQSTFGAKGSDLDIPKDGWLQTDGSVTRDPCPALAE